MSQWVAEAPSNIALIKYMGKLPGDTANIPSNPSLSYTLTNLRTRVELSASQEDHWVPLQDKDWQTLSLSEQGQTRFIKHFQFLKKQWGIEDSFEIASANNFPSDCGLASSASSFAALTLAAYKLAVEKNSIDLRLEDVADLSRQGSGSSCRSFFKPWAEWGGGEIKGVDLPQDQLLHLCLVISDEKKEVSSSHAHQRVTTSPNFNGRFERATQRLEALKSALSDDKWSVAYEICWDEFEDMHNLFETSVPEFSYREKKAKEALKYLKKRWKKEGDGPLVTMDAGPNIHLLFRPDQSTSYEAWKNEL